MFFSCIRQRGGWNNNPSAVQFRHAYRCLLVHADVKAPTTANVAPDMDGITALRHQGNLSKENDDTEEVDSLQLDTFQSFADHDYLGATHGLTEFSAEIVQYVGGFIVRVVSKKLTCSDCLDILVDDHVTSLLVFIRNNGGLIMPSLFVRHALNCAESTFRHETKQPQKATVQRLVLNAFKSFIQKHQGSLSQTGHYKDSPQHVITLTRLIIKEYMTLRLRELCKRLTEKNRGAYVRAQLTKQILFKNQ